MGVYSELHPYLYQLLSLITSKGPTGLGYLVSIMNRSIDKMVHNDPKGSLVEADLQESLVGMMYEMHRTDPETFTEDDIRFHVVPLIGGGSDTTASTLSAIIYHVIKSPSVLYKLRRELNKLEEAGRLSRPIRLREAAECQYLQACIKETTRVHSGIGLPMPRVVPKGGLIIAGRYFPAEVRFALYPIQIDGILISHVKTVVGINPWVSNFNFSVYGDDAMVFRPERWLDAEPAKLSQMEDYFLTV